jgi:O-antigen ligase
MAIWFVNPGSLVTHHAVSVESNLALLDASPKITKLVDREELLRTVTVAFLVLFVLCLPRYRDIAKHWFYLYSLISVAYFVVHIRAWKDTIAPERFLFGVLVLNFAWLLFSFYINEEPGRGASIIWNRHFHLLLLIPLYFLFKRVDIAHRVVLIALLGSTFFSFADILVDFAQGVEYRFKGMNPNKFGPIQLCIGGILFCYFVRGRGRTEKTLALAGCAISIVTVLLSQSKATWVALLVVAVVIPVALWRSWSVTRLSVVVLLSVTVLASTYFLPIVKTRIEAATLNITEYVATDDDRKKSIGGTFGDRMELWKIGWWMFQQRPVTGLGPGSVQIEVRNRNESYPADRFDKDYKYLHNQYITAMATRGFPGLVLLLLILGVPVYIAIRNKSDSGEDLPSLAILTIILVYMVVSIPDDHFESKGPIMFFATFMAYYLAKMSSAREQQGCRA